MNTNIAELIIAKMNMKVEEAMKKEENTKEEVFQFCISYMEGYLSALEDLGHINFLENKICQCELMKSLHLKLTSGGESTELFQTLNEWEEIFFTLVERWNSAHKIKENPLS